MGQLKDITGQKFGRLLVLSQAGRDQWGQVLWQCLCDCGNTVSVRGRDLRTGPTRSCGCYQKERARDANMIDLVGQVFGQLTVLRPAGKNHSGTSCLWLCRCSCGRETKVQTGNLASGNSTSCGCIPVLRHGYARRGGKTGIYISWVNLRARCQNPNNPAARYYLERGIIVDPRWESFESFRDDTEATWFPGADIHRKDPAGPYAPDNFVWLTRSQHTKLHWELRRKQEKEYR